VKRYEVTTARLTPRGRIRRTRAIEAEDYRQNRGTAVFTDHHGQPVAKIKHVVRICWA
jgi:hypothetical protein